VPSPAALQFTATLTRARTFSALAEDARLRPLQRDDTRLFLHAALASHVAAWESYVERLITNFLAEIIDIQIPKFVALHSIVQPLAETASQRFSTPNWENTRSLLVQRTGYDPINDWAWQGMPGPQVRQRLNQILQIRHSFAHGFPMPAYDWNTSATGQARLTQSTIRGTETFFINLVKQTDKGMRDHISTHYNPSVTW
jgi:RiboL-PSP-HEPN